MNEKNFNVSPNLLRSLFFLSIGTENMYSAALPFISEDLCASPNIVQTSSTVYFIGFSLGIISLGIFSDKYGRKPVLLSGLCVYVVSSFLCFFILSVPQLLFLRFFQAFGASVASVIGQAIARDSYRGFELSHFYSSIAITQAILPSISCIISGYIIEYVGWRYDFIFMVFFGFSLLCLYGLQLPETNCYTNQYVDYKKVFFSFIKDIQVLRYALIIGCFNGIMYGILVEIPFIFIDNIGLIPSEYGKLFLLISAFNLLGCLVNNSLVKKYVDNRFLILTGLYLSLFGCVCFCINHTLIGIYSFCKQLTILMLLIPISIHFFGHSFVVTRILKIALERYKKVNGTAGAFFGCTYYCFIALVSYIVAVLHSSDNKSFALLLVALSLLANILFYLNIKSAHSNIVV